MASPRAASNRKGLDVQRLSDWQAVHKAQAASPARAKPSTFPGAAEIEESFAAWRRHLASDARWPRPAKTHTPRPLTSDELTAVNLATVRESKTHRRWPREVVEKFLAAELILSQSPCPTPGRLHQLRRSASNKLANIVRWPLYHQAKG